MCAQHRMANRTLLVPYQQKLKQKLDETKRYSHKVIQYAYNMKKYIHLLPQYLFLKKPKSKTFLLTVSID